MTVGSWDPALELITVACEFPDQGYYSHLLSLVIGSQNPGGRLNTFGFF